jgi:hypothetical protein
MQVRACTFMPSSGMSANLSCKVLASSIPCFLHRSSCQWCADLVRCCNKARTAAACYAKYNLLLCDLHALGRGELHAGFMTDNHTCCSCLVAATAVALSLLAYMLAEVPLPMAVKHYVYGESEQAVRC